MLSLHFSPFPTLHTERLQLRALSISDDAAMFALRTNALVNKYLDIPQPSSVADVHPLIKKISDGVANNEAIFWVITMKGSDALIGTICYWHIEPEKDAAEIGYTLMPEYWRKGLMHEAMNAVLQYGLNKMQLRTIAAWTHKDNNDSLKLLQKNNFVHDMELERMNAGNEELETLVIYSLKK